MFSKHCTGLSEITLKKISILFKQMRCPLLKIRHSQVSLNLNLIFPFEVEILILTVKKKTNIYPNNLGISNFK